MTPVDRCPGSTCLPQELEERDKQSSIYPRQSRIVNLSFKNFTISNYDIHIKKKSYNLTFIEKRYAKTVEDRDEVKKGMEKGKNGEKRKTKG